MNRTLRRAVGVAACTLALAATTGTAHAETQSKKDPRGDVTTLMSAKAAPKPGIDIVSSTNQYKGRTLTLKVTAANLVKDDFGSIWVINAGDTNYLLQYIKLGGQVQSAFQEIGPLPKVGAPMQARGVQCEGFTVKPSFKNDTVVATVPRSCLAGANTVRVGLALVQPSEQGQKVDDARRTGFPAGETAPKFGPELDRN